MTSPAMPERDVTVVTRENAYTLGVVNGWRGWYTGGAWHGAMRVGVTAEVAALLDVVVATRQEEARRRSIEGHLADLLDRADREIDAWKAELASWKARSAPSGDAARDVVVLAAPAPLPPLPEAVERSLREVAALYRPSGKSDRDDFVQMVPAGVIYRAMLACQALDADRSRATEAP